MNECDSVAHKTPEPTPAEPSCKGDYSACQGCSGEQCTYCAAMEDIKCCPQSLGYFAILGWSLRGQASIFVDLVACAALSVAAVRRRRGPGVAAFAAASLALSPAARWRSTSRSSAAAAAAPRERTAARIGRVLVVGAGASGLAQGSKRCVTAFSDFRLGRGASHLALDDYVAYLERYVDRFGLARTIEFGTTVRAVARAGGRYAVETEAGGVARTRSFDRVAVCSGLHAHPKTPALSGRFRGDVFHSRDYASPGRFAGKRVVVGAGETAFDVAHGAASAGARAVTMSTRRGFVSVPASFGEGVAPLDCIIANAGTRWESAGAARRPPLKFPFLFGAGAGDDRCPAATS
ncbi:N,N-dimethylaniline monooxygenase [Aureococcus anophagefferens]|nr:N,N-dimethylaniline monooxygenase [Aureococcus anophagefferens]